MAIKLTERELHPENFEEDDYTPAQTLGHLPLSVMINTTKVILYILICLLLLCAVWIIDGGDQRTSRMPIALTASAEVLVTFLFIVSKLLEKPGEQN